MKKILIAGSFFVFTLVITTGCASSMHNESAPGLKIIDAHIHASFSGEPDEASGIIESEESLLKEMKENNVVGAVSHTDRSQKYYTDLKKHGIIHCYGSGPRPDAKKLEEDIKNKKYSCIKIYLGYVYQYANDPNYLPLYKLAEKYYIPVVFHTGDPYDKKALLKYADPITVDEIAVKYPDVNFVIAHLGSPWIQTASEVAYKNDNVYIDVSALLIGDLTQLSEEDIDEFVVKPIRWAFGYCEKPTKLMFGTDWSLTDMKSYIRAVKKAIPREHWHQVFYNNAQAVFKIPGLPERIESIK